MSRPRRAVVPAVIARGLLALLTACAPGAVDAGHWQPAAGVTWQWQLGTDDGLDLTVDAAVYDVDGEETRAAAGAWLRADGRKVICYVNAGGWEEWRSDADAYPAELLGNDYDGWPGERWVDIRRIDLLGPILEARVDVCAEKGFDGVEFDNMESQDAEDVSGFAITVQDQLDFNRWLARTAHDRGLAAGLKNDAAQAAELEPDFDYAITEDCHADGWCDELQPFLDAGKPVFAAEYTDVTTEAAFRDEYCPAAGESGQSLVLKRRDLDAWRLAC